MPNEIFCYVPRSQTPWDSELRRIYEACEEENVKVEFQKLKSGFLVTFYRRDDFKIELGVKLGVNEKRILEIIARKYKHITIIQLVKDLNISTTAVKIILEESKKRAC